MAKRRRTTTKRVDALTHEQARRTNIPTAEHQAVLPTEHAKSVPVRYERGGQGLVDERKRRDRDLDPQFVWRGKDGLDWSDLVVDARPLYIQEKVHPKALIDDLRRHAASAPDEEQPALFADFNGFPDGTDRTEFYQHEGKWQNRMILGDSLQVMASLAEREGLRGKVQCIYLDPPYGIKFNSNFQWSTTSRDVKDGNAAHITREPEQVKAFRDTWRDGIHSYLTYLRDRLTVARDLLTESGSIFVQIGDENVHRVRAVMDEVFGDENFINGIVFGKTSGSTGEFLGPTFDHLLWYGRSRKAVKFRPLLAPKAPGQRGGTGYRNVRLPSLASRTMSPSEIAEPASLPKGLRVYARSDITSQSIGREKGEGAASWFPVNLNGRVYRPSASVRWKTNQSGMRRLLLADRVEASSGGNLGYVRYLEDYPAYELSDMWQDTVGQNQFGGPKLYVVQTALSAVQRCLLMTTDPGDLVLDPTCGSGTTAYVSEQWGRRWITIDTSRVALALARARIMGARYDYYLLADSPDGREKEAEVTRTAPKQGPTGRDVRHGFVYERVPHITLKSIANNAEIDVIWERFQERLEPLRTRLNSLVSEKWEEWEVPREADDAWPDPIKEAHASWWKARIARQHEIDASIAAKADFEYLYDKPYVDRSAVRVAGPFTVESLSPHRMLEVDEDDAPADPAARSPREEDAFVSMILDNLRTSGVQQSAKDDRIAFIGLTPWPGRFIAAEGRYQENGVTRRAGIFVGPEFGTVGRADLVDAAREAGDAGFDVVVACAFNYDAHASEFTRHGRIQLLKARMNADLHMADDLKNTGKGNLFVLFGEPDVQLETLDDGAMQVEVLGVDVFDPSSGEVRSDGPEGIACWFLDSDYDGESFFVRHAYFLGAADPYRSLKSTLKAEIDEEAWASLNSAVSRPFPPPSTGRIAVKVINHLGDEVMKVFRVEASADGLQRAS